jgi:hypothetical protein
LKLIEAQTARVCLGWKGEIVMQRSSKCVLIQDLAKALNYEPGTVHSKLRRAGLPMPRMYFAGCKAKVTVAEAAHVFGMRPAYLRALLTGKDEVIGTKEAAEILGVSMGRLRDDPVADVISTGHRRYSRALCEHLGRSKAVGF